MARQFEKDPADWTVGWNSMEGKEYCMLPCRQCCPSSLVWLARFPATACRLRCHSAIVEAALPRMPCL